MSSIGVRSETAVILKRTFTASPHRVFQAWVEPEQLKRWFAPSEEYSVPIAEVDARVGGRYRIQMKAPDGKTATSVGVYREVLPGEKLVFTWAWEEHTPEMVRMGQGIGETLVTVEFLEREGSTELILTHENFPDKKARDDHEKGWTGCLGRLGRLF